MSSVLKPSGPRASWVYWVRRAAALGLAVVVVAVAWVWMAGGSEKNPAAASGQRTAAAPPHRTSAPAKTSTRSSPARWPRQRSRGHHHSHPSLPAHHRRVRHSGGHSSHPNRTASSSPASPLASPTGVCDLRAVSMQISVGDSVQGHRNTATFLFTVPSSVGACTLPITPDSLVARITSGSDVVWSSDDCPDAMLAKEVVVRHDPPTVYSFEWNGHRSTHGCATSGDVAPPGEYTLEAALVGGDPHKAFFSIVPDRSTRR